MNLSHLSKKDQRLNALTQQVRLWQRLELQVKKMLPLNLADFYQISCVNEQGALVVFAHNAMVASRLKMIMPALVPQLQGMDARIIKVLVKVSPQEHVHAKYKKAVLGQEAQTQLLSASEKLSHHPELAQALSRLALSHSK
ncbi:DciA family protein [Neisseria sp. Ec49-e6-T10]|uniref:DciA family protein n=1 Tax=Neisseria sp. Ec49-e6-T10 TaxID=3140744 RepID=UPI003EBAF172